MTPEQIERMIKALERIADAADYFVAGQENCTPIAVKVEGIWQDEENGPLRIAGPTREEQDKSYPIGVME